MLSTTPSRARTLPGVHTKQEFARQFVDSFLIRSSWYFQRYSLKGVSLYFLLWVSSKWNWNTRASLFARFLTLALYIGDLRDNRSSTDIIERGLKSSAGPNRNRDIFYCHAQSARFSFPLDSVSHSRAIPFTTRIAKDLLLPDQQGRYLNIRSLIHPVYTDTHAHMHTIYAAYLEEVEAVEYTRGFVWYITEDVDCSGYDPAALHCRGRDNGYVLLSSSPYSTSHSLLVVSFSLAIRFNRAPSLF